MVPEYVGDLHITAIAMSAFSSSNVKNVVLPDSVVTIGSGFGKCYSLQEVVLGAGVQKIADDAFQYCYSLEQIQVSEQNENYCSVDGVLFTIMLFELESRGT